MSSRNSAPILLYERITERDLRIQIGMQRDEIGRLRRELARTERIALALAVGQLVVLAVLLAIALRSP